MECLHPDIVRNGAENIKCRSGWSGVLSKHIRKLPDGYTKNHVFEFENGQVKFKYVATTPDEQLSSSTLFDDVKFCRKYLLTELFGHDELNKITWNQLKLPPCKKRTLTQKKLKSLGKKYLTIPKKFLSHYPILSEELQADVNKSMDRGVAKEKKRKRKSDSVAHPDIGALKKRKVGRPRKLKLEVPTNQDTILKFFSSKVIE